ncbi:MAG TPA: tRNA (guanosine(46)-N7)-methyltransferase TrmB [Planctomycetes bacterium]|nr:tRNA (guanosine(46)-N7)-methyltransferase TrmB [Fuerstiella sp.]HIK96023.1 tRNA (guanosine(46)-N7)-methyltransferase TrmB [Planctomycetota bacterium]
MQTAPVKPLKPWFQVIDDVGDSIVWSEFFGNENPVELDIGCGRGLFLFTAAQKNPDINYLGLEIDYREGRRTAERLKKQQMQNARVIGGDCNVVLTKMIEKHSVSAAHVYFPDPWWKKRHHKRRLFTQEFTGILSDVVQPNGHVHSWSDVAEYFDIIKSLMDGQPDFNALTAAPERDPVDDMDYQTSFERKKRKLGLPIYRGLWQRKTLAG